MNIDINHISLFVVFLLLALYIYMHANDKE